VKDWFRKSLPKESHTSHFRAVIPKEVLMRENIDLNKITDFNQVLCHFKKNTKICINLAATGQYDYDERMEMIGKPLAEKGIVTFIMINPLYGVRKCSLKKSSPHIMKDINSLICMGSHCLEEVRALVYHLYD
jgi:hypothetical protein